VPEADELTLAHQVPGEVRSRTHTRFFCPIRRGVAFHNSATTAPRAISITIPIVSRAGPRADFRGNALWNIEYILLEASGVADPGGIFATFSDANLRDRVRLDSVICVVDADQVFAHPEYPPLMQLKLHQVDFADMLILNKVDLAGPEQVAKVRAWLDEHFNRLRIVETNYCEVPCEILLGVGRFDPARAGLNSHAIEQSCTNASCHDENHGHNRHGQDHSKVFSTWSYETDQPLALEALRETLRKLPGSLPGQRRGLQLRGATASSGAAGGGQARGHFHSGGVGPAGTAHADRCHWCGRLHRCESARKNIRLLHLGG
jgi:CobW/HypB/UreG, nucleotide-binding domain